MIFVLIIQVFKRLQKLLLCLSHKRSIAYVDKLGASHDAKVLQWKLRLEEVLFGSQNLIAELIDSAENAGVVSGFNPNGDNCYTSVLTTSETSLEQNAGDELNSGTVFEGLQTSTTASAQNTSIATITLCTDSASPQDASASPDVSPLLSSSDSSSVESITAPDFSPLSTTSSFSSHSGSCNNLFDYCDTEGRYKSTEAYPTFKIVGDNLDKYVKPRDMIIDAQASTIHYFHMYCMLYAIVLTHLNCQRNYPNQNKKILKLSRFYFQMRIIKFYLLIFPF